MYLYLAYRFLHRDGIVRPFNKIEAEGNDVLSDVEKGLYKADVYVSHIIVTQDLKALLLATNKRVLFAKKEEIFGLWKSEWQYPWSELKDVNYTAKGIQVVFKVSVRTVK